jgi:hypothetical protein
MPKRSNEFQRLIKRIYEQLANSGSGETVKESEMIADVSTGVLREVDVLLEREVFGHKVRIAVECRSRNRKNKSGKRKQSVEWIDQLKGKYSTLPIDKVIAVSESGFTENARLHAQHSKIELVTIEEANEMDWPTQFHKFRLFTFAFSKDVKPRTMQLRFKSKSNRIIDLPLNTIIYDDSGKEVTTLSNYGKRLFDDNHVKMFQFLESEYSNERLLEEFPNEVDLREKVITVTMTEKPDHRMFVSDHDSTFLEIIEFGLVLDVSFQVDEVPLTHHVVANALVTQGDSIAILPSGVRFTMIQSTYKPNQATYWWESETAIQVTTYSPTAKSAIDVSQNDPLA